MEQVTIHLAIPPEHLWAAAMMASSEPWVQLGISKDKLEEACRHPEYQLFIAHAGKLPCGVLLVHPRGLAGAPYIKSFAVDPAFRGRGVGERMLVFAEEHFRAFSPHLFLCVSSFNERAGRFYAKHGFSQVGELKDYLVQGASEFILYKRLQKNP